jgi:hypothetical protein
MEHENEFLLAGTVVHHICWPRYSMRFSLDQDGDYTGEPIKWLDDLSFVDGPFSDGRAAVAIKLPAGEFFAKHFKRPISRIR